MRVSSGYLNWSFLVTETGCLYFFILFIADKQHLVSIIVVVSTYGQILKALYSKSYGNFLFLHPCAGIPCGGVKSIVSNYGMHATARGALVVVLDLFSESRDRWQ